MVNIGLKFNATTVKPMGSSVGNLPISDLNGWPVKIVECEMKAVKGKADCAYLEMVLEITEGEHAGSQGIDRLNIHSDNEKAVEISLQRLSAYCHVTGCLLLENAEDMIGKEFVVTVGAQKGEKGDEGYTEIKKILHIDGSRPGKGTVSSAGAKPSVAKPKPKAQPKTVQTPEVEESDDAEEVSETPKRAWGKSNPVNETFEEGATTARPSWKK